MFDKTFTHLLSMVGAVYGVFIYSIAFSLEMWFIVTTPYNANQVNHNNNYESQVVSNKPTSFRLHHPRGGHTPLVIASGSDKVSLEESSVGDQNGLSTSSVPILAFVLAAMYFVIVMVSLLLILGIIIRSMMCILIWLITIVLSFFPEAALVMFITVYHWVCNACWVLGYKFLIQTFDLLMSSTGYRYQEWPDWDLLLYPQSHL